MSLGPLDDADTARIVAATLERAVLPAETQTALLARADGNPLYAEQYARMIAEGGDTDALPEGVQGIVAARLDLLAAEEKSLLQDAAVVGRVFWPGALATSTEILRSLARKEFIRRERRSSIAGEDEFSFAHALVRDVAYAQIPRGERAVKHRAAAEWIETLPADRAADRAEMVAHHYAAALELATASGVADDGLRKRARDAFVEAGERTLSLNAFRSAKRHFAEALELTPEGDTSRARILLGLGRAIYEQDGPPAVPVLEEAAALFAEADEREWAATAEILCARAYWYAGRGEDADESAQRAVELLADAPPSQAKVEALAERARLHMLAGNYDESAELATSALGPAEELGVQRVQASLLITRGTASRNRGDIERGIALAEATKDVGNLQRGWNNLAEGMIRWGDLAAAFEAYEPWRRELEQLGLDSYLLWQSTQEASLRSITDDWDRALELLQPLLAILDAGESHYLAGDALHVRAGIRHARGDTAGALDDARRGLEAARSAKDVQATVPSLGRTAELVSREGEAEEGLAYLDEALALAQTQDRPYYSLAPNLMLAVLDLSREEHFLRYFEKFADIDAWTGIAVQAWRGDLLGAADRMAACGATTPEAELRVRAAARLRAAGDSARADEQLRLALAFFQKVHATRRIRDAEALLAATA